ncbi:hypothetical protein EK21DRAFT_71873 [Setomelanomma holmii]|uniref:Uncharacterized protein n=1 Tax=Setomelanomma holmii TaxID=210430 RepID=A0A9P4LKY6_9PLEO|nr:hypothetical protein EK21DRAFT_71873 [Setomelanomma holmii]
MRVGTTDIDLDDLVDQIKARNMPKRVRTPNCTHLDMDRVFGRDQRCVVCGRESSIGFLYECKQDCDGKSLHDIIEQENDCEIEIIKSDTRLQLEWAGLSESVILTAEKGHYTPQQLEKLKAQKQELREIISDQLQASSINDAAARLAAMAQTPPNTDGTLNSTLTREATDMDKISAQRRPQRRFYRMGHRTSGSISRDLSRQLTLLTRQGLKTAFHGIFRSNRESSSQGSNITLPLPRTGTVRDSDSSHDVGDFDLPALRKVRRQKERNEVKKGLYVVGFEGVQGTASASSHHVLGTNEASSSGSESESSLYSSASRRSKVEVEADGGVALTEEAVETRTPDILAVGVSIGEDAAIIEGVEIADEDEADIGLQSIMTQA